MKISADAILCYVDGKKAFFVTGPLNKVWGDDWDDAPYEHNAGEPTSYEGDLFNVFFDGPYETPADIAGLNSTYSVEAINRGDIAWLTPSRWERTEAKPIHAGTTFQKFCELMHAAGGSVYVPLEQER